MSKRIILTVSDDLYLMVENIARDMGVSVTEYIRYLILKSKEQENAANKLSL